MWGGPADRCEDWGDDEIWEKWVRGVVLQRGRGYDRRDRRREE